MEQKVLRTGTVAIICALLLRLLSGMGAGMDLPPKISSAMIFLQTGRFARPSMLAHNPATTEGEEPTADTTQETESIECTESVAPSEPTPDLPVFSPMDAAAIGIKCGFSYSADKQALLCKPLDWNLADGQPAVLIYHSHATESFSPANYQETSDYHTLDSSQNMISVGAYLATLLEAQGIRVIHDTSLHDNPSYTDAYTNSRKSVQDYLKAYPTIRLVLDLHRDAYEDENGNQVAQTVFSEGTRVASLMFVVGSDYGGGDHPQWRENLALALKLQTLINGTCPGICRNINLRSQKFNQDLSPGTLLVEVGAAGNTQAEALRAAQVLADGIGQLAHGSL